jgi:hypothetical protein
MTNRSRFERAKRAQETQRAREIQAEWFAKLPAETAREFTRQVEAARARGPAPRPADMPPGTPPNPPRPGREPKPAREERGARRRARR